MNTSPKTEAIATVQLRAVATSRADADVVLSLWRAAWGARLSRVREPRCGRAGDWLVYADLRLDALE